MKSNKELKIEWYISNLCVPFPYYKFLEEAKKDDLSEDEIKKILKYFLPKSKISFFY